MEISETELDAIKEQYFTSGYEAGKRDGSSVIAELLDSEKLKDQMHIRRMSWLLQVVMEPGKDQTLGDAYLDMDENFWGRVGL